MPRAHVVWLNNIFYSITANEILCHWGVRFPAEAKDFSFDLCAQTGSEAHPASYAVGTAGQAPGLKRGRGVNLTTPIHLVPRLRMSRMYTSSHPKRHHGV
jgi:hypothetical protein